MNIPSHDDLYARAAGGDAQAQFLLGRASAGKGEMSRARRWFRAAADQGHAGALTELGLLELFGIGTVPDIEFATKALLQAERGGSAEAAYQLGVMGWCLQSMPFDLDQLAARLHTSARGGHAPALRAIALVYARMGGAHDALVDPCLEQAVAHGDPVSAYMLALRLGGRGERQGAAALAALALTRGVTRAAVVPDAASAAPASIAVADLPPLPVPDLRDRIEFRHVRRSDAPFVQTIEDVVSPLECEFIIALGLPYLKPSVSTDANAASLIRSVYRTSEEMSFYSFQEDYALRWLQWRMVDLVGSPLSHAEHTVLLRYLPGQEYRPHRDFLPPSRAGNFDEPNMPGQRVHTVFCYLNDVEEGGETAFPLQHLKIEPRRGRVVHFKNVLADGQPDGLTLHAGLPVLRGEKWLATLWTRQRRMRTY